MDNYINHTHLNAFDILYSSYIRYSRMYEMSMYAFYGINNIKYVNIYIDLYSILRRLFKYGRSIMIQDSCAIASSMINLAIHIRAFFRTRGGIESSIYLIYGGAKPKNVFSLLPFYNSANILIENNNFQLQSLILDNLNAMSILCMYLPDIYCIIDTNNEFSVISNSIINNKKFTKQGSDIANIIYSKDRLPYQLVAYCPRTFLYRPNKHLSDDTSWVVTKTSLYDAYRYNEIKLKKMVNYNINVKLFSLYQSLSGIKDRSVLSIKNANYSMKILSDLDTNNYFINGYDYNSILSSLTNKDIGIDINLDNIIKVHQSIDISYQTMMYTSFSIEYKEMYKNIVNLVDPNEVRNINNKYFDKYPLDLNRV